MDKKWRRLIVLSALLALLLTAIPTVSYAADVTVTIPGFSVTLNGTKMDNTYSQYPLIVYKDITYFPMTYYDCRFLGLETTWSKAEGLKIQKTGALWNYTPYTTSSKNGSSYRAAIAQDAIEVNGEKIHNSKEDYPLLQFRNVTYFPLTWRFAVNSFGWSYHYDNATGLTIQATGVNGGINAGNATANVQEVILPIASYNEEPYYGGFAKYGNNYYYQGVTGVVYQAPILNPNNRKAIYQFEGTNSSGFYDPGTIYVENGKVFLKYHVGGGVMGRDYLIHLKEDGTHENISPDKYFDYKEFTNLTVIATYGTAFSSGNLQVRERDGTKYETVGEESIFYRLCDKTDFVQGDDVYAIGFEDGMSGIPRDTAYLHKVNSKTGKSTRVSDTNASIFAMDQKTIYFAGNDYKGLYRIGINDSKPEKLSDVSIEQMVLLDGTLFYVTKYDGLLYQYGNSPSLNPGSIATDIAVKDGYVYARFRSGPYRIMVFDKNGKEVAKTIENVADLSMENGKVVFVKVQ